MAESHDQNWYRVCLNTIVRKGKELDSERLRILPMGSRVRVTKTVERRVKIDQPIEGWCSLTSSNGDQILHKLDPEDLGPTTPQMRSSQGKQLLAKQYQNNHELLERKAQEQSNALANPEVKRLFDDIQNIKEQLKKTESQSVLFQREAQQNKALQQDMEVNNLKVEDYNEKIKLLKAKLKNKQDEISQQAKSLKVSNPDELKSEMDRLEKHNITLKAEMEHNNRILADLQQEAKSIANMMSQYIEYDHYKQDEVLVGDVLKLDGGFGMAVVGFVAPKDAEDNQIGCFFEAPLDDEWAAEWPDAWPKLCNGAPHMEGKSDNQCFYMAPDDPHLSGKFLTGATILEKLLKVSAHLSANEHGVSKE